MERWCAPGGVSGAHGWMDVRPETRFEGEDNISYDQLQGQKPQKGLNKILALAF